jgi:hypothetical protein
MVAVFLVAVSLSASWGAENPIGKMVFFGGDVTLRRVASQEKPKPSIGLLLYAGDIVVTGSNGKASIQLTDGSQILVNPKSIYTLEQEKKGRLQLGELFAKISPGKGVGYAFQTPTATASVSGTKFLLRRGWICVTEGRMGVANSYGAVEVGEREFTTFTADAAPKAPTSAPADVLDYVNAQEKALDESMGGGQ